MTGFLIGHIWGYWLVLPILNYVKTSHPNTTRPPHSPNFSVSLICLYPSISITNQLVTIVYWPKPQFSLFISSDWSSITTKPIPNPSLTSTQPQLPTDGEDPSELVPFMLPLFLSTNGVWSSLLESIYTQSQLLLSQFIQLQRKVPTSSTMRFQDSFFPFS